MIKPLVVVQRKTDGMKEKMSEVKFGNEEETAHICED